MQNCAILIAQSRLPELPINGLPGALGLFYGFLILFMGVLWAIFPFIVYHNLGNLLKESKKQTDLLDRIANHTAPAANPGQHEHTTRYNPLEEESTGMVWIIIGICLFVIMAVFAVKMLSR